MNFFKIAFGCVASLLFSTAFASAQILLESFDYTTPTGIFAPTDTFTLPVFNANIGTLVGVDLTLATYSTPIILVYNPDSWPMSFTNASVDLTYTLTAPDATTLVTNSSYTVPSGTAPAGPLVTTYSGPSAFASSSADNIIPVGSFIGTAGETITLNLSTSDTPGGTSSCGLLFDGEGYGNAIVTVDYYYLASCTCPEPSTYALIGLGFAALAVRRLIVRRAAPVA